MGNVLMKAQQIVYGASNVEAALNNLDVAELIELNKRMAAIDEWKANVHEVTYTGPELTINNALALPARSLITEINAIQDLHGYDKPWTGGANVQLVDFSAYSTLVDNVSLSYIDGDLTLRSTGTTPNYPLVQYDIKSLKGKTLYFACDFSSSAEGLGHIQIVYSVGGQISYIEVGRNPDPQTGRSIPNIVDWVSLRIYLRNGTSVGADQWAKFGKIMCASSANPTYSPYSNICPISGRTEARVDTENEDSSESAYATIQLGTTVYGADINWDTGVMTVKTTAVDGGSLNWSYWDSGIFIATIADKTALNVTDIKCSCYKRGREDGGIFCLVDNENQKKIVYIWDSSYSPDATGAAALKTALTGQQIEYRLATPTTLQLTPTQLQMLKGYNRVTIEDGSIELKALVLGGDN